MDVDISAATPDDLNAVLELIDASGLPRAGLDDHISTMLVVRERSRIVGTAALELYGGFALLRSVAVAAPLRGQGLGHRLTTAALDLARRRGVRTVYLLTETAGDFFPRFGFRKIERSEVDQAVQASQEFTSACPASALVMATQI